MTAGSAMVMLWQAFRVVLVMVCEGRLALLTMVTWLFLG